MHCTVLFIYLFSVSIKRPGPDFWKKSLLNNQYFFSNSRSLGWPGLIIESLEYIVRSFTYIVRHNGKVFPRAIPAPTYLSSSSLIFHFILNVLSIFWFQSVILKTVFWLFVLEGQPTYLPAKKIVIGKKMILLIFSSYYIVFWWQDC